MKRASLLLAIVVLAGAAFGQSTDYVIVGEPFSAASPNTGPGTPTFGSFTPGTVDVVNNQNLNVHLVLPFAFLRGRGMGFNFSEVNDSQIWIPGTLGPITSWVPVVNASGSPTWGWQTVTPNGGLTSVPASNGTCGTGNLPMSNQTNFIYTDAQGTNHPFPSVNITESCSNGTIVTGGTPTGYAIDNSGYFVNATTGQVFGPSGVIYMNTGTVVKDTNGNFISETNPSSGVVSWVDTSGTTAWTATTNSGGAVTYADPSNNQVTITVRTLNIKTNFGCPGVAEYAGTATVPYFIYLPNGAFESFSYESTPGNSGYSTGRLQEVSIITGLSEGESSTIQYAYTGPNDGINCADGTTLGLTRTVTTGITASSTWTFTRSSGRSGTYSTTVTAPQLSYDSAGNQTVYSFDSNGHEVSRQTYEGTAGGTLLRTINTTWATSNGTPATSVTILNDNSTQSEADTVYDQTNPTGNLQSLTEYDWGNGQHGPQLRQTNYTYYAFDPNNTNAAQYASRNLVNLVSRITIQSGSTIQSRQDIAYDGALISSCPTGVPQHDDTNYGCSFVYRGNPTLVTTYTAPATAGGAITRSSTYDFFGNLLTAQLSCCQQKTWVYSNATNYSFPDSITSGSSPSLTTAYTYNVAGQVLTVTDPNSLKTSYVYNTSQGFTAGAGPLTSITRPDGSVVSYSYTGSSVTVTTPINSSQNLVQVTNYNANGQPTTTSVTGGSTVQYQYDALSRLTATSNPYTSGNPGYFTTTQFDALGRPTKTTLPDGEQTTYGYSAQSVTVTDPTGKEAKGEADAAGRLIEADQAGGTTSAATPGTGIATVNVAGTGQVSITGSEQVKTNSSLVIAGHDAKSTTGSGTTIADPIGSHSSNPVLLLALVAGSGSGNTVTGISGGGTWTLVRRTNTQSGTAEIWKSNTTISSSTTVTATFASTNSLRMLAVFTITGADANSIGATASASSSDGAPSVSLVTTRNNSWVFGVANDPTNNTGRTVGSGQTSPDQQGDSGVGTLWDQRENSATPSSGAQVTLNDTSPSTDAYNFTAVEVLAAAVSYDTGTVTLTANGHGDTVNYGQNDTPSTIATALANAINADSAAFINATPATGSGNQTLDLTARTTGNASDYAVSTTSATNNSNFSSASFSGSSTTLSPGSVFDSGTVSVTVNGVQSTASYAPGDTASSVAVKIAAAVSANNSSTVTATATGSDVVLVATTGGTASSYPESSASQGSTYPQASFSLALSGPTLTGATNGGGPSMSAAVATYYTYDVMDDLTQVTDRTNQTRTYVYDGLGRLTSSAVPETGNVATQFVYDSFNNLTQRTDPRGVVTTYGYDGLNRLAQVSYNVGSSGVPATPTVSYTYGTSASSFNNGLLASMTDGAGTDTYTYDKMGRKTQCVRVITSTGVSYTTSYTYNELNEVTQTTYPSGRVVQQSYDSLARLCEVAPSTTGCGTAASPYATGYAYNVANELTGFNYGNGVAASMSYSPDRLQLTSLAYAKGTSTLFSLNYDYAQGGGNDGQITGITDNVDHGRSAAYSYDALSRLASATTVGSANYSQWGLSWNYDQYGNRTAQNVTAGNAPANSVSVSAATNQITTAGYKYDAAGNMTNDGVNALTYDAENRITISSGGGSSGAYTYDGYSQRIEKTVSGATTVYIFSNSQVIAEYASTAAVTSPTREYVYGGALLAKIESSATQYYHQDQLSNRLMTDSSGNVVGQQGHYPYGEQWYPGSPSQLTKWEFTSYERDAESNNDYAMARYYVNRLGRFNSLDPLSGSTGDPQSLDRYTYTENDPLNVADPSGMYPACLGYVCFIDSAPGIFGGGTGCLIDGFDDDCGLANILLGADAAFSCGTFCDIYMEPQFVELPSGMWKVFWSYAGDDGFGFRAGNGEDVDPTSAAYELGLITPGGSVPSTGPYVTPGAAAARQAVITLLSGKNPCSAFFNNAAGAFSEGSQPSAVAIFQAVDIRGFSTGAGIAAETDQGTGWTSPIFVNSNGAFYNAVGIVNFQAKTLSVGPYTGGTLQAQMVTLLHEFAHDINAVPRDTDKPNDPQSAANTDTILNHCEKAIK
jgi:RHS repeat-associated protein